MTAVTACQVCGSEPLENARFCHGCGSPIADADTRAEYKQVTVLFADVVHSMDSLIRDALDHLVRGERLLGWGIPVTGVAVETLLDRGAENDVAEAEAAIERLAAAPSAEDLFPRDIFLLRLRALLARARGDAASYAHFRDRYRDMSKSLGFEGHTAWAEAMP